MREKNFALSAYALQSRMEMSNLNMQNTKRAWPEWLVKEIVNPINFSNTFYVTWAEKNQNFTENAWARPEILQFLKANISYTITS